jgi:hypothetical protein
MIQWNKCLFYWMIDELFYYLMFSNDERDFTIIGFGIALM